LVVRRTHFPHEKNADENEAKEGKESLQVTQGRETTIRRVCQNKRKGKEKSEMGEIHENPYRTKE